MDNSIFHTKTDDDGKKFRATGTFWTESEDLPSAYKNADCLNEEYRDVRLGSVIPGHHTGVV